MEDRSTDESFRSFFSHMRSKFFLAFESMNGLVCDVVSSVAKSIGCDIVKKGYEGRMITIESRIVALEENWKYMEDFFMCGSQTLAGLQT